MESKSKNRLCNSVNEQGYSVLCSPDMRACIGRGICDPELGGSCLVEENRLWAGLVMARRCRSLLPDSSRLRRLWDGWVGSPAVLVALGEGGGRVWSMSSRERRHTPMIFSAALPFITSHLCYLKTWCGCLRVSHMHSCCVCVCVCYCMCERLYCALKLSIALTSFDTR